MFEILDTLDKMVVRPTCIDQMDMRPNVFETKWLLDKCS